MPLTMPLVALAIVLYTPTELDFYTQINSLYYLEPSVKRFFFNSFALFGWMFPVVSILILRLTKQIDSIELDNQKQRFAPLLLSGVYAVMLLTLLFKFNAQVTLSVHLFSLAFSGVFVAVIFLIVNLKFKISLHAAGVGILLGFLFLGNLVFSQEIALLKYAGGGDWYANPTSLPNLISYCNKNINTAIKSKPETVELNNPNLFSYPFIHLTGHGNVFFNEIEVKNLRNYLLSGGFLHIDDNFGLDVYIRREMKKVFPDKDFIELPINHLIFQKPYLFPNGLPKIHEHDGKKAQAFALLEHGKIICLYTYECDLGNGWEDFGTYPEDTQEVRTKALKMGSNLIQYALTQ